MGYVFISYSHQDSDYVRLLRNELEKHGFDVWFDENIEYGERWFSTISNAIRECSSMIVVMTPEAENSVWVEKEIMIAQKRKKPIFPLILEGEVFDLLITEQALKLTEDHGFLPPLRFYKQLASYAPRTPIPVERPAYQTFTQSRMGKFTGDPPPIVQHSYPSTNIDLFEWTDYSRPGTNDFYGIAMLSICYEARGEHKRAMFFLRKAQKLESRITDKAWMTEHYRWYEQHHKFIDSILNDPNFWDVSLRG